MLRLTLPIRPASKPAGSLTKHGKMSMKAKPIAGGINYGTWQHNVNTLIKNTIDCIDKPPKLPMQVYGIIYIVVFEKRVQDLSNAFESVQDCLVQSKVIQDDSVLHLRNITAFWEEFKPSQSALGGHLCCGYDIYLCETAYEYFNVIKKHMAYDIEATKVLP